MINAKLVDGEHIPKEVGLSKDEIALIETKDAKWLEKRILMEKRKIERLRNSCTIIETGEALNQHILFLDEDEKDIDLAEKFGTEPELLDRPHNRIRTEQLEKMPELSMRDARRLNKAATKTTVELEQRLTRLEKLQNALKQLDKNREAAEKEKLPEVENKKLAKKFNFVNLRKK